VTLFTQVCDVIVIVQQNLNVAGSGLKNTCWFQ